MDDIKIYTKVYLWVAFALGILGLIGGIIAFFPTAHLIYAVILSPIGFLFFFFSIATIVMFVVHKQKAIALVLPIYHVLKFILGFAVGFIIVFISIKTGLTQFPPNIEIYLRIFGFALSIFEIIFPLYLLRKLSL